MFKIHNSTKFLALSIVAAIGAGALIAGCGGGNGGFPFTSPDNSTVYGPTSTFGSGTIDSFLTSRSGQPFELGIEISKAAIDNPATLPGPDPGAVAAEIHAPLPAQALAVTPFLDASIFFTFGHPPVGAQDVPHIHPSWFLVNDAVRNQIMPGNPANTAPIAANEIPPGYITLPDPTFTYIPTLGTIYFTFTDPGYSEAPFKTALSEYRYFNGHMTLIALGAPNSFLLGHDSLTRTMTAPAKYPKPGNYPTNFTVRFDSARQMHVFTLGAFVARH